MPESFAEGLTDKTRSAMIGLLNARLADTISLTLAVKQAHWNMKGKGFIAVHELMDEVAGRLRAGADEMAERAVILGGLAEGTVEAVSKGANIAPYPTDLTDLDKHVDALVERYRTLGSKLRDAIRQADDASDAGTADLFTGFSRTVDKDAWFIGANTQGAAK